MEQFFYFITYTATFENNFHIMVNFDFLKNILKQTTMLQYFSVILCLSGEGFLF